MSGVEYDLQYTALTQNAWDQFRIIAERPVLDLEKAFLKELSEGNRQAGVEMAESICKDYRRTGRYFDEIMEDWDGTEFR